MAKWLIPVLLVVIGLAVFAGGPAYGVVTVGVPTPDAQPAVAAREARDSDRAFASMAAGLVTGAVGAVSLAGVAVARAVRRRVTSAEPGGATADGAGR